MDLHSHLLPGLDDGAATMEETRRFARRLHAEGVLDIACTPHVKRAHFPRIDIAELASASRGRAARDRGGRRRRPAASGRRARRRGALELTERELALIAQGPAHAPWLLLECPSRASTTSSTPPSPASPASARPPARAPRAGPRPARPAEPHVETARCCRSTCPRCWASTAPRRGTRPRASFATAAPSASPAMRPGHAREHAPARLPGAGPGRRE